ncbi:hypothetical protein KVY03_18845, partial [Epilithonimonas sp. FP105]
SCISLKSFVGKPIMLKKAPEASVQQGFHCSCFARNENLAIACWPSFVHCLYFYFFERWQNFKTTFFNGKGKLFKHFLLALCGCQNA